MDTNKDVDDDEDYGEIDDFAIRIGDGKWENVPDT